MARKFDVSRALTLYEQHEATRINEGLINFDPGCDPLRTELETGKFTVLVSSTFVFLVVYRYFQINQITFPNPVNSVYFFPPLLTMPCWFARMQSTRSLRKEGWLSWQTDQSIC